VYCCIVTGRSTCMLVCPPSPKASESELGGGSSEVPEWQLLDWDDFPDGAGGAGGGGGSGADDTWHVIYDVILHDVYHVI
jgi:hypothetical protein